MKLRFVLKAFNQNLMQEALELVSRSLENTDAQISGKIALPMEVKRFCVLRSPHIDKDSREHFEIRIYKQFFDVKTDSIEVLNDLMKINLPSGLFCYFKTLED